MKPWRKIRLVASLVGAAALCGCDFNTDAPSVEVSMREWYPSDKLLIPFEVHGNGVRYGEFRYEYNAGAEWVVNTERTVRMPSGDSTLIELTAAADNPAWNHRVTFSALAQAGPGQPLEPFATSERYFRVDTTTPSAETGSLQLIPYEDGVLLPGPPYTFDEDLRLDVLVYHPEFDAPSGSAITIYGRRGDSLPDERDHDEELNVSRFVRVWDGGAAGYFETLRFIVIDEAGNRSGVRTVVYAAP